MLVSEVKSADIIVLGVPMYNYSMPASLKAWFDLVARIGHTFSFDLSLGDYPIQPIETGKKLVILSSRGEFGFRNGGARCHLNGLDPALAACAPYLGALPKDIETITVEYEEFKDERWDRSVADACRSTEEIATKLANRD
jgi:FMN-dependent NADH-azoreductase